MEVVRPKVGAAVFKGDPGDLPREIFCKKTQNLAFWDCACSVQSSRVQYSVRLQMHGRSMSTSLEKRSKSDAHTIVVVNSTSMHRWILIFLLRFCTFRTDHTFRKVVRPWSYQS